MDKDNDLQKILKDAQSKIYSYSAAPYTISTSLIPPGFSFVEQSNISYTNIIFISLWKDYGKEDLEAYLRLSEEYLSIDTVGNREAFIEYRIKSILPSGLFEEWKELHASLALGIVINSSNSLGYRTKILNLDDKHAFLKKTLTNGQPDHFRFQYAVLI